MPAYPCVDCGRQVDIRDFTCRGCGTKKPFRCTRCNTTMSSAEVHGTETMTFAKPLFCLVCGREAERFPCHHCRTDVVRKDAVEYDTPRGPLLYHPECFKTTQLQEKVSKYLMFFLIPFLGWMGGSYLAYYSQPWMWGPGILLGALAGWFGSTLLAPRR